MRRENLYTAHTDHIMTDVFILKTGSSIVVGAGLVAVLDPAVANIALAAIAAVVAITTVVFTYKTAAMNKKLADAEKKLDVHDAKIEAVVKTSDGMKTELVNATALASRAEGLIAGIAQAEGKEEQAQAGGKAHPTSPSDEQKADVENTKAVKSNTMAVKENTSAQDLKS